MYIPLSSSVSFPSARSAWRQILVAGCLILATAAASAASAAKHAFDLGGDTADRSIKLFSDQSGQQVIVPSTVVAGVRTNAVKGDYTAREALDRLLAGTGLVAAQDEKTGAFAVKKSPPPGVGSPTPSGAPAQPRSTSAQSPARDTTETEDEAVRLTPFEVRSDATGYLANNSAVATGFSRDVKRTPLVLNIVTSEFIRDAGFNSYADVADFIPNTYIEPDPYGLGSTSSARGHATSYYSQDGYRAYTEPNVRSGDRIEVVKGPATLFFGRAQPGGIFNFSTPLPTPRRRQTLQLNYGSFDRNTADFSSQGALGFSFLTHRFDYGWQENGSFLDHGYSDKQSGRLSIGIRPSKYVSIRLLGEQTFNKVAGNAREPWAWNPAYFTDYRAPNRTQIAYARTYLSPTLATDDAAVTFLQGRWRESPANWSNDTRRGRHLIEGRPINEIIQRATGFTNALTPYGWEYNSSGLGSEGTQEVQNWGGEITVTPFRFLTVKAGAFKYDLSRKNTNTDMRDISPDGVFRSNIFSQFNTNNSKNLSADAITNFALGPTKHTLSVGYRGFEDNYRFHNGTFHPLNAAPIPGQPGAFYSDVRRSGGAVVTNGWNAFKDGYFDISRYVLRPAWANAPSFLDANEENAYFGSYILELFDGRVGLLGGLRHQEYKNTISGYTLEANLPTVGLSWEVVPDLVLFASRSQSFEPGFQSSVEGNGTTAAERNSQPAPPREGDGFDLGVKFNLLGSKLVGTLSYFQTARKNDFRNTDVDRTNDDPRNLDADPNNNVTWFEYGGQRLSKGVDFELQWAPTRNYTALFTLGYLPVARITSNPGITPETLSYRPVGATVNTVLTLAPINPASGNQVGSRSGNSPEWKVSVWNRYVLTEGKLKGLQFGAGVNWTNSVQISTDPSFLNVRLSSYALLRTTVEYPIRVWNREIRAALIVSNVTDKKYYRGASRGEPRSFGLRLSSSF